MSSVQSLKKQLKGIKSTQKLAKAMKTISTVKFSKLNGMYSQYSEYGNQCRRMFEEYGAGLVDRMKEADPSAVKAVIVIAGNKGMCGSFNSALLNFASEQLSDPKDTAVYACGKKAISYFKTKNIPIKKEYILNDVPTFEECKTVLEDIFIARQNGEISEVSVVYSSYKNMMVQTPAAVSIFKAKEYDFNGDILYVPNRETVIIKNAKDVFCAMFYELVLETALGAQAATLMTMRSAYDTATELVTDLEGRINRMRQSLVTADVIETSSDHGE